MGKLDKVSDENHSAPPPTTFQQYSPVPANPEFERPPAYSNFQQYVPAAQQATQIIYPDQFNTSVIPGGNMLIAGNCPPLDRLSNISVTADSDGSIDVPLMTVI
jgi:hypothetical protein